MNKDPAVDEWLEKLPPDLHGITEVLIGEGKRLRYMKIWSVEKTPDAVARGHAGMKAGKA